MVELMAMAMDIALAAANTVSTEAINSTATAISTLPDTAFTSAYAAAKAGPLLEKSECLYCDSSRDIL